MLLFEKGTSFPIPIGMVSACWLMIVFLLVTVSAHAALGQGHPQHEDSIVGPDFSVTPRFNSSGHFPYTGALINRNVNFDINIYYEYRGYGFFVFKSWDLEDPHSIVNYLQPGIFKKLKFSPSFQLGVFFGYLFSQTSEFRDQDSDYYTAAVAYWTLAENLKLENTSLFFDLAQSGKLANRLLVGWGIKSFRIDFYVWHRWVFEEGLHATSGSLAVNFPRIRISEAFSVQSTASYQGYITSAKPDFAMRDGFLLTIGFPMEIR